MEIKVPADSFRLAAPDQAFHRETKASLEKGDRSGIRQPADFWLIHQEKGVAIFMG
jgi:hypothetical protein